MSGLVQEILIYPQKRLPGVPVPSVDVVGGKGLLGDHKRSPRRQVTLLSLEMWQRACAELGVDLAPSVRRANLVLTGVELSLGTWVEIGDVRLRVTEETKPCWRMNAACPGLKKALEPELRAGVIALVEVGGLVRLSDPVRVLGAVPEVVGERESA